MVSALLNWFDVKLVYEGAVWEGNMGVKLAGKNPSFAQSLDIFVNWHATSRMALLDLNYLFYNLPLQIQTIEDAL